MTNLNKVIRFIKNTNDHHLKKGYDRKNVHSFTKFMKVGEKRECRYRAKCFIDEDKKSLCRRCAEILKQQNFMKMIGLLFEKFNIECEFNQRKSSIYVPKQRHGDEKIKPPQIRISDHWAPTMTINPPTDWKKSEILVFLKVIKAWGDVLKENKYKLNKKGEK